MVEASLNCHFVSNNSKTKILIKRFATNDYWNKNTSLVWKAGWMSGLCLLATPHCKDNIKEGETQTTNMDEA